MSTALELRAITHHHRGAEHPTLDAVDLEVHSGQMVAVLGPSGSGKTTLLRVAAGLERPGSGDVRLDGSSVLDLAPHRRDLTVMFQRPHLFPHLNVLDNVAFAGRLRSPSRSQSRAAAQRYLDLVHLGDLARRRPRALSGGQEQRVALARALAAERRVMLLDEPFSALDTSLRASMHQLLGEVRAALDPTIVIVTHDLDEAGLAERVAVLVDGRIEQMDTVAALHTAPASVAVARLVGGFNELPGTATRGRHRSPLGAFALPPTSRVEGPAVLLVRKERLTLAPPERALALRGQVIGVRQSGAHHDVSVELDDIVGGRRIKVEVQARLGTALRPGERTGVLLPGPEGLWVVPAPGPDAREPQKDSAAPPPSKAGADASSMIDMAAMRSSVPMSRAVAQGPPPGGIPPAST